MSNKVYLGDAVYAEIERGILKLTKGSAGCPAIEVSLLPYLGARPTSSPSG